MSKYDIGFTEPHPGFYMVTGTPFYITRDRSDDTWTIWNKFADIVDSCDCWTRAFMRARELAGVIAGLGVPGTKVAR